MKPTIKTSGFPCLSPTSAAAGGLPRLSRVSDGCSLGHAAGPKAGSQAEPPMHSQNLDQSLYQGVVWGLVKALLTPSPG